MSIIAYYAHVDDAQLQALHEQPALVWHIQSDPKFARAALFDVGKDYDILAWLLSEKKRKEQAQQMAAYRAMDQESQSGREFSKEEFSRAKAGELEKLGVTPEDTNALPTDPALEAIEGRGSEKQRDARLNYGMGNARLFKPDEVKRLAEALKRVTDDDLRNTFDREVMAKFDVGGMDWLSEHDDVLGEILIPAFHRLRAFYVDAEKRGHHVVVFYQ